MATKKNGVERGVIPDPPPNLTTPCTLLQLHNWVQAVHATAPGVAATATITTNTTTITVA